MDKEKLGIILILISAASFGAMAIFAKFAYEAGVNTTTILFFRFSVASLALWSYLFLKKQAIKLPTNSIISLSVVGILGYGAVSFSFFTSVELASASLAGILLFLHPTFVYIVLLCLKKEIFDWNKVIALIISFIGLILVLGVAIQVNNPWGIIAGISAAIAYTFYIVFGDNTMKNIPPLQGSAVVITSAAFVFLLTGIVSNQLIFPVEFIPYIWMSLIALISTVIAIGFFWLGVVLIGPTKGTIISTLEPVVTVFLAYFFLGETLSLLQIFGGLLILAGVVIIRFNFDFSKILYNDFGSKKTL